MDFLCLKFIFMTNYKSLNSENYETYIKNLKIMNRFLLKMLNTKIRNFVITSKLFI